MTSPSHILFAPLAMSEVTLPKQDVLRVYSAPNAPSGSGTSDALRAAVLAQFGAKDHYDCILTSGAPDAAQILGERYPFDDDGTLLLTADSHPSVQGVQAQCARQGGTFHSAPMRGNMAMDTAALKQMLLGLEGRNKLFTFPRLCCSSGVQHKLKWVRRAQRLGWDVFLDATQCAPRTSLCLLAMQPEFVAVSLRVDISTSHSQGALLVRKDVCRKLSLSASGM